MKSIDGKPLTALEIMGIVAGGAIGGLVIVIMVTLWRYFHG